MTKRGHIKKLHKRIGELRATVAATEIAHRAPVTQASMRRSLPANIQRAGEVPKQTPLQPRKLFAAPPTATLQRFFSEDDEESTSPPAARKHGGRRLQSELEALERNELSAVSTDMPMHAVFLDRLAVLPLRCWLALEYRGMALHRCSTLLVFYGEHSLACTSPKSVE